MNAVVLDESTQLRRADALRRLADDSIRLLSEFINARDDIPQRQLMQAKYASVALSAWAKLEQTSTARSALTFAMARELARDDGDKLNELVRLAMPSAPVTRALVATDGQAN